MLMSFIAVVDVVESAPGTPASFMRLEPVTAFFSRGYHPLDSYH